MKPFFKPEDFNNIYKKLMKQGYMQKSAGDMWEPNYRVEDIAKEVNEILAKLIEASPVVYAEVIEEPFFKQWHNISYQGATHSARLICVEPIVKEECKHEGRSYPTTVLKVDMSNSVTDAVIGEKYKCSKCGVELKAEWSELK